MREESETRLSFAASRCVAVAGRRSAVRPSVEVALPPWRSRRGAAGCAVPMRGRASAFMGVPWAYSSYTELWKAELMQHATRAFAHSAGASGGA
jgi:hypothetical protein